MSFELEREIPNRFPQLDATPGRSSILLYIPYVAFTMGSKEARNSRPAQEDGLPSLGDHPPPLIPIYPRWRPDHYPNNEDRGTPYPGCIVDTCFMIQPADYVIH